MSSVSLEHFTLRFAEELKVEERKLEDADLRALPEYDSMAKINISLLIEEIFELQLDYEVLKNAKSVKELYDLCSRMEQR